MDIIGSLKTIDMTRSLSGEYNMTDPVKSEEAAVFLSKGAALQDTGNVVVNPETAQKVVAFYRGIQIIAQSLAHLPFPFPARDKDSKRDPDGAKLPAYQLFNVAFNSEMTPFEGVEMMIGHFYTRGAFYGQKILNAFDDTIEIWPLHPDRMKPFRLKDGSLKYAYWTQEGKQIFFEPTELFVFRNQLGPDNMTPVSPVKIAASSLALSITLERFSQTIFKNAFSPAGVLKHPGDFEDDESIERLRKQWDERYSGVENVGRPLILEAGMDWKDIGLNPEQNQMLDSRSFQLLDVARVLGVPPIKLGITDKIPMGSAELVNGNFYIDTLLPLAVRLKQAIQQQLMKPAERAKYQPKMNFKAFLAADYKTRNEGYAIGRQWGWFCPDDIRELEDMPALPDGQGKNYLVPGNMIPAQLANAFWQAKIDNPKAAGAGGGSDPSNETDNNLKSVKSAFRGACDDTEGFDDLFEQEVRFELNTKEVRVAFLQMAVSTAETCVRKEIKALESALKQAAMKGDADSFRAKVDDFYSSHESYIRQHFAPIVDSLSTVFGARKQELATVFAQNLAKSAENVVKSARNRLNLQNFANEAEVFVKLGDILEDWRKTRASALAQEVLGPCAAYLE